MFCLSGNTSEMECELFPPLELGEGKWGIGLVNLCTFNSIPNIENDINNYIRVGDIDIEIPEGSYEITQIDKYIKSRIGNIYFDLRANNNTLQCEMFCDDDVDLSSEDSIASLLGFENAVYKSEKWHTSTKSVNIQRVNSIRIECNIASGTYNNGLKGHTIHEFFPHVQPGFKIVDAPPAVIYVPVTAKQINTISVRIVDQDGRLINFRGEVITIRLHLKRYGIDF